jgi:hypothetical protein
MGAIETEPMTEAEGIAALAERRVVLEAEMEELQRARGAALLDGKVFNGQRLHGVELEIATIDAAEAEWQRRQRAHEALKRAEVHDAARHGMAHALSEYLSRLEHAERTAKALGVELQMLEMHAETMRQHARTLGCGLPISLEAHEVTLAHSRMLASVLRKLAGHASQDSFGALTWNSAEPIDDWGTFARKYIAAALQPLIEGDCNARH